MRLWALAAILIVCLVVSQLAHIRLSLRGTRILTSEAQSIRPALRLCTNFSQFEDLPGEWIKGYADTAARQACPAWTKENSCLHHSGRMPEHWSAQEAYDEYNQVFQPHACRLRAWDAAAFDACAARRRVVLIGDSLMRQMFLSLACLLSPVTQTGTGGAWGTTWASKTSCTSDRDYSGPAFPGKAVQKIYWGDMRLRSGAAVHARIIGSYSGELIEDLLAELPLLAPEDVLVVNFGAWYPRFAMQGGAVGVTNMLDAFKQEMAELMKQLRVLPALCLWRSYAPTHFGGEQGGFVVGQQAKEDCSPASVGETYYDQWVKDYLTSCGSSCSHIHMLPVFLLSLPRHKSHLGSRGSGILNATAFDCRHYCDNVLDVWNQVLFNKICPL